MMSEDTCNICGVILTEKNSCCCWESECQNTRDVGSYCVNCYPSHVEAMHGRKL